MTESALTFFKQVIHWNVNLAVLVLLAWCVLGRGKAARTTLAVWSILLIRALAEPWLCPQRAAPLELDFAREGMLSVGLGLGWGERTLNVVLGLGDEQISVGDLTVLSLGQSWAAFIGGLFLLATCLNLAIRLYTLWGARGADESLIFCEHSVTPHISGWWKPSIVIPKALPKILTEAELEAIVCHEQAHLRRGDQIWFALLYLLRSFCPILWPLKIIIDSVEQAVERLCDRAAAAAVGQKNVARALVKAAEFQAAQQFQTPIAAYPLFSKHPITERVTALARSGKEKESFVTLLLALFLLAAVIL